MQQNRWFSDIANPLNNVVAGSGTLYNNEVNVTATIPDGTKFKIVDIHEGIVEAVGEGIDLYQEEQKKDLRRRYRGG